MSSALARWHSLSKKQQWLLAIGFLLVVLTLIGAFSNTSDNTTTSSPAPVATAETPAVKKSAVETPAPVAPSETAGQENARRTAESYLEFQAFSRTGLIKQLKFEGYSEADATYAVDNVTVNWNEQAAKAAQSYLDMQGFSRSGLIGQLEFEGYTPAQAIYGVNAVGL